MGNTPGLPIEPELPQAVAGKKRRFPEDFRRRAVAYYDSLPNDGSKGAYLRRSGIFSSSINGWRKAIENGVSQKKVGRKPVDSLSRENAALQSQVAKLQKELERANTVIEVQKKVTSLLELHLDPKDDNS